MLKVVYYTVNKAEAPKINLFTPKEIIATL